MKLGIPDELVYARCTVGIPLSRLDELLMMREKNDELGGVPISPSFSHSSCAWTSHDGSLTLDLWFDTVAHFQPLTVTGTFFRLVLGQPWTCFDVSRSMPSHVEVYKDYSTPTSFPSLRPSFGIKR